MSIILYKSVPIWILVWLGKQDGLSVGYSMDSSCDSPGNHTMPSSEDQGIKDITIDITRFAI
jgi:hypothetical protein